jgi:hypothetical protein
MDGWIYGLMYASICICICICTYVSRHLYIEVHLYVCVCVCACMHAVVAGASAADGVRARFGARQVQTARHPARGPPCHPVPCRAVPWCAVPCRAIPCHPVPCRAVPWCAVPWCAVPCHGAPCRGAPCHTIVAWRSTAQHSTTTACGGTQLQSCLLRAPRPRRCGCARPPVQRATRVL